MSNPFRFLAPRFWREQSRRVESMADPANTRWDPEPLQVNCDRCGRDVVDEWVSVEWQYERDARGQVEVTAADVVAAVCLRCVPAVEDEVRAAVARAVRS